MGPVAALATALTCAGLVQGLAGYLAVRRFRPAPPPADAGLPAISVLKPLYGDEPLLEEALGSVCVQDYPAFQVILGVQDHADPALAVAERVRAAHPGRDVLVLRDDTADGPNRKVANLINMLARAKHDVLLIADSDMHAAPDYLRRVAAALAVPGTGLVTTLYTGRPANRSLVAALGASGITHGFLPGTLLARALGRQDCLGATMALHRATLARAGGLQALLTHVADDHVLGHLVRGLGLSIGLADTLPATTVPEARLRDLLRHELRWGRTVRSLAPVEYALSAVQYPCVWALLAVLATGAASWTLALLAAAWAGRAALATGIDRALARARNDGGVRAPIWLLPVRDVLSVGVLLASFAGDRVDWRGRAMRVDGAGRTPNAPAALAGNGERAYGQG